MNNKGAGNGYGLQYKHGMVRLQEVSFILLFLVPKCSIILSRTLIITHDII